METWIRGASLLLTTVLAGLLFGLVVLGPALRRVQAVAYVQIQQGLMATFTPIMIVLMPLTLLTNMVAMLAAFRADPPPSRHFFATGASAGFTVAVVAATLIVNVPLARQMGGWNPKALPANVLLYRDRWERLQLVRALFALLALVAQIVGVV